MLLALLGLAAAGFLLALPARAAGPPIVETKPASAVTQTTATLNGMVNPNGELVTDCKFEYGTTVPSEKTVPCSSAPGSGTSLVSVSAAVEGLTPNTTYHFRVSATNSGTSKGSEVAFKTLPNAPIVETKPASAVTQTTATLNGMVNPNGELVTDCKFEYGTTVPSEKTVPCSSAPGSGTSLVSVSAAVEGLTPNTTYHFRVSATNAGGMNKGSEEAFKTLPNPPSVESRLPSAVTPTAATLNATVNPNGGEVTECKFEYGTTNSYGSGGLCTPAPGSGTTAVPVSMSIAGLTPSTTYHFRVSATNAGGPTKSKDQTFTTPSVTAPPVIKIEEPPVPPPKPGFPPPVLGRIGNIAYVTGRVSLRLPGTRKFVALFGSRQIPYRTIVEATHGEVSITSAKAGGGTQTALFFDGQFMVTQTSAGTVVAKLTGGNFRVCRRTRKSPKHAAGTHLVRRLWATASGSFSTTGKYAAGAVRGAQWLTEDVCKGTLILTTREHVQVTDLVRHRNVDLPAGGVYISRAR